MLSYMISSNPVGGMSGISSADARMIAEDSSRAIELRLQSLELACAALWTILKDKHGYSDEMLVEVITDVDGRDGKVDGKISRSERICPTCERKVLTRNPNKCSWCGGALHPLGL